MSARTIVFAGAGGAGVSTLAAATAAGLASDGRRTLAFGVGPGLSAAFDATLSHRRQELAGGLWAIETGSEPPDQRGAVLDWLRDLFAWRNMDETLADDVAALPGLVDLARLLELEAQIDSGEFDVVVVDLGALRHSLDLLAALDAASRSLERMFPERQATVFDPFLRALTGSAGAEEVYENGRELLGRLARLRDILADRERTSVRLVSSADSWPAAALQPAIATLSLFDYPVDAVLCNRLLPREAGTWFDAHRERQGAAVAEIRRTLAPLPVLTVAMQPAPPAGLDGLRSIARLAYEGVEPSAVLCNGPAASFARVDGRYVLSLSLPFVSAEDLVIERLDGVVIVHMGGRSRTFDLPEEVGSDDRVSSTFESSTLRVTFSAAEGPPA